MTGTALGPAGGKRWRGLTEFLIEAATAWLFKNLRSSYLFIRCAFPTESVTEHGHDAWRTMPSHLPTTSMTETV